MWAIQTPCIYSLRPLFGVLLLKSPLEHENSIERYFSGKPASASLEYLSIVSLRGLSGHMSISRVRAQCGAHVQVAKEAGACCSQHRGLPPCVPDTGESALCCTGARCREPTCRHEWGCASCCELRARSAELSHANFRASSRVTNILFMRAPADRAKCSNSGRQTIKSRNAASVVSQLELCLQLAL